MPPLSHLGFHLLELGQQAVTLGFPFEQEFPIATDVIGRTRPTRVLPQRSKMPVATDFRLRHNSEKPLRLADLAFDINED
jgi:hypothetical protein